MSAVINIELLENNADDELLLLQKRIDERTNRCDDENFLGAMPTLDDASMMLVDEMLSFVKTEPTHYGEQCMSLLMDDDDDDDHHAVNVNIDENQYSLKEEPHSSSDGDTGSDSPFDPNDFFNDIYKSEVSHSSYSSPSYRNTPSPSNSQSSGSEHSSDYNSMANAHQTEPSMNLYGIQQQQRQQQPQQQLLHFQPQQQHTPMDVTQALRVMPEQQPSPLAIPILNQMPTANGTQNNVNILQGTLIPIKAVSLSPPHNNITTLSASNFTKTTPMKKIKIQPKPASIQENHTKAKTIVLSAKDYKALMAKCKSHPTPVNAAGNEQCAPLTLKTCTNGPPMIPSMPVNTNDARAKVMKMVSTSAVIATTPLTTVAPTKLVPINLQPLEMDRIRAPKISGGEVEDRVLKKQMRMIKNRESACMSRKKKKDYVTSLESRISDLSKENQQLKSENATLKSRLKRVCDVCGSLASNQTRSSQLPALTNMPKKSAAFLLAFVFMISFTCLPNPLADVPSFDSPMPSAAVGTRRLLWIDDTTNDSAVAVEDGPSATAYPMCPLSVSVNQTESIRLASELQRWIGDFPEYFNVSKSGGRSGNSKDKFDLNEISDYLLSDAGGQAINTFYKQIKNVGRRLKKTNRDRGGNDALNRKFNANRANGNTFGVQTARNNNNNNHNNSTENRVQVYNADAHRYAEFFDEIRRQDDTFYVVSFKGDHLLLPAVAHNKTFRPKMSLMLPAVANMANGSYNDNGMFTLMQIDCEVVNTSVLHIKESSIPDHLWKRTSSPKATDGANAMPKSTTSSSATTTTTTTTTTSAGRIRNNLPLENRMNRNRIFNNETAAKRPHRNVLPTVVNDIGRTGDVDADDSGMEAVHVAPLKPHRPYFLHKTDNTNRVVGDKVLNDEV